jgi:hypothetical protein
MIAAWSADVLSGTRPSPPGVAVRGLVITIERMAKKRRGGGQPAQWKGDAVEARPSEKAEEAARRAEGNEPVRADAESARLHHGDVRTEPSEPHRRPPHGDDPEEETAEAAEAHRARDAEEQPPRGKL